jgi:hypothetical protein
MAPVAFCRLCLLSACGSGTAWACGPTPAAAEQFQPLPVTIMYTRGKTPLVEAGQVK